MHSIHVGYVGLVGNARYGEMADFLLGFAGIDIAGDDGRKLGSGIAELHNPIVWARGEPEPPYTHCERCGKRIYAPELAQGPGGWSPVRAARKLFVRCESQNVCRCPGSRDSAYASRPRLPGVPVSVPLPGSLPVPSEGDAVSALPEDCPVRQAIEGKSPLAQVGDGAAAVVNGGAKVVGTTIRVGRFAWQVGRVAVKVVLFVPKVIRALIPSSRKPESEPPSDTRTARRPLPRP